MKTELQACDGRKILLNVWQPEGEVSRVIVLSHGMSEHILRYEEFALACTKQGIAVLGANHRGHGAEADQLGHFADKSGWELLLKDLDTIVDYASETFNLRPVLFGHSMGSFAARHYAIRNGAKLSSLILCGSNHQGTALFKAGRFAARTVGKVIGNNQPSPFLEKLSFGNFNKKIKPLRTDTDWLCRDESVVDAYNSDPYCGFTPTPQFWIDLLSGLNEMSTPEAMSRIPSELPVYVISGDSDPVNNYGTGITALVKALKEAGIRKVDCRLYQGARHELLNETNKEEVYQDIFNWLDNENTIRPRL
ncbi:alpha/beta hydrolase [Vibrio sp. JC009]|uniref:alpha/beta fold hydrolase n=1 Tax=Vibrio sp. JC009 TaxID=2912314 RepID=UPI0023AF65B3|nr:alpha/beta hydrolase [Vibrio sp. JC009]WED23982.1 alpha/beta hydrolase [Vibrio sp. JC009]